jgi:hypothetical protein
MKKYLNFDLEISKQNNAYLARVIYSPEGEGRNVFIFPFNAAELKHYLASFSNVRGIILPARVTESPSTANVITMLEIFGKALFDAVFQNDIVGLFRASIKTAQQEKAGLRLRLRLADVPEMINIPWEYLFDSRTNTYLSLSNQISIVRYMELPSARKKLSVSTVIKLLIVISNPTDYALLDTDLERKKLNKALAKLSQVGDINIKYVQQATISNLLAVLETDEFHIIHFIGHGYFDENTQAGGLVFEDENEKGVHISGKYLATAIQNEPSLRLIVLNSCEGGVTSNSNIFAGVAQGLVKKEIPAVLAMQYAITDQAAIVFAEKFYTGLANGKPVDTALGQARRGIYHLPNELEFGTAVLYMRAERGTLFGEKSNKGVWRYKEYALTNEQHIARVIVTSFLFFSSLGMAYGIYQWAIL